MSVIIFNGPSQAPARAIGGVADIVPFINNQYFSMGSNGNANILLSETIGRTYTLTGFAMTLGQAFSSTATEFGIWTPRRTGGIQLFSAPLQNNLAAGNMNSYRLIETLDIGIIGKAFEIGLTNFPIGHDMSLTVTGFQNDIFPLPPPPFPAPDASTLKYWFAADIGVFSNADLATPAANGDKVAGWKNISAFGTGDGLQPDNAFRPTFRTGGINGLPFIEFNQGAGEFFTDVEFVIPSGSTAAVNWTVAIVTDNINPDNAPGLLGAGGVAGGGKARLSFRSNAGSQVFFTKSQFNVGNVTNPMKLIIKTSGGSTGNPLRFILNSLGPVDSNFNTTNLNSTASNSLRLFRSDAGVTFGGRIYELMIWQSRLSDAEMLAVSNYFSQKYGL